MDPLHTLSVSCRLLQLLPDPWNVRTQAVEAEGNDQLRWFAARLVSGKKLEKPDVRLGGGLRRFRAHSGHSKAFSCIAKADIPTHKWCASSTEAMFWKRTILTISN